MGGVIFKLGKTVSSSPPWRRQRLHCVGVQRRGRWEGEWHKGEDYVGAGKGSTGWGRDIVVTAGLLNSGVEPG